MSRLRCLPVIIAAACVGIAGAREPEVKLPDIGSSAAAIMSPAEMHDLGASLLHELRAYNLVLDDPLVGEYLNSLGYRLVSHSDRPDLDFTFFVVDDPEINAFAVPGGFVGVNAGMITVSDREDELAAVMAHEISHITQNHLLRAYEAAQKASLPIALAMLGAMIASAHRSDDAGTAAIVSGTSLMAQRQINFTRQDEAEADRVGIQTLARAGFDPMAMANTFATLQRVMRTNGVDVPAFLQDHPVDTVRIADAKARAGQLERDVAQQRISAKATRDLARADIPLLTLGDAAQPVDAPARLAAAGPPQTAGRDPIAPSLGWLRQAAGSADETAPTPRGQAYYALMRERVRVLSAPSPNTVLAYYAKNLHDDPAFDTPANHYGHALALIRNRQPAEAVPELQKLLAKQPASLVFQLALAHAQDQAGDKPPALRRYAALAADFPGNRAIVLAYSESLLAIGDAKSALKAQDLLRPLLPKYSEDPEMQRSFARACELAGDKVRAGEAYAEAAFLNGHAEDALNQLKSLSRQTDLSYYQRARIDARITALTPIVLDLRKRGIRPDQQGQDGSLSAPAFACTTGRLCVDVSSGRNNPPLQ